MGEGVQLRSGNIGDDVDFKGGGLKQQSKHRAILHITHLHTHTSGGGFARHGVLGRGVYPYSRLAEVALSNLVCDVGAHEHAAVHAAQALAEHQCQAI